MRDKLLIELINCKYITITELRVAVYCRTSKTLEKISKKFDLSTPNTSRICSKLVKMRILIAEKVPGHLKKFKLNYDWKHDIEEDKED